MRTAALLAFLSALLHAADPCAGLTPTSGTWDRSPGGSLRPDPALTWSVALAERPAGAAAVETVFTVHDSGVFIWTPRCDNRMATYGEDLLGEPGSEILTDAAIVLDWNEGAAGAPADCYRIEVGAHPQAGQIVIWKRGGCWVAQTPVKIPLKKPVKLRAASDGAGSIRVWLDGAEVLAWRDPMPLKPGKVGIAALKGIVEFSSVSVAKADAFTPVPAATRPAFALRRLLPDSPLTEEWLFDGDEPVLRYAVEVGKGAAFDWMKLRPGVQPPIFAMPWYWSQMTAEDTDLSKVASAEQTVGADGAWTMKLHLVPKKEAGASADLVVKLTRDCAANRYVYEVDTRLKVAADKALPYRHPFEFLDPWPHGAKATWQDREPTARQRYQAIVWEQPGDLPPRRVNLSSDYLLFGCANYPDYARNSAQRPLGTAYMGAARDVNVMVRYLADPGHQIMNEMCHWGYDWHVRIFEPAWSKTGIPAGTELAVRLLVTHEEEALVRKLLERSRHFGEGSREDQRLPVVGWPVTTFAATKMGHDPRNELLWVGGHLDETLGNGDRASLRLEAKEKLVVGHGLGVSFFAPARRYFTPWNHTLTFDVRCPGGDGKVTARAAATAPRKVENRQEFAVPKGEAWTTLTLPADAFIGGILCTLDFTNTGSQPVWIDNVRFSDQPPEVKPVWTLQAESLNVGCLAADAQAVNGWALGLPATMAKGTCIFGPYDTELPAGDYLATVRVKTSDNQIPGEVLRWDIVQSEGASKWAVAGGTWKGADFASAGAYLDKTIPFHRDAGGRLSIRFYRTAAPCAVLIDQVTFRRITDAWGNPLPEKRDRW